jgi:hypothetical protein
MEQETCQPVPVEPTSITVDTSRNLTGFEGKRGYKETQVHREMFALYCDKLIREPDKYIKDILAEIGQQYNRQPVTMKKISEDGCWPQRFKDWRKTSKEIGVHDPRFRVNEMVKDLEKLSKQGSNVLYDWLQQLDPKKLVGREVELISNIVLKATELAAKAADATPDNNSGGINVRGNNVQLIIKE